MQYIWHVFELPFLMVVSISCPTIYRSPLAIIHDLYFLEQNLPSEGIKFIYVFLMFVNLFMNFVNELCCLLVLCEFRHTCSIVNLLRYNVIISIFAIQLFTLLICLEQFNVVKGKKSMLCKIPLVRMKTFFCCW